MRILVVDDEKDIVELVGGAVGQSTGAQVTTALSGDEALQLSKPLESLDVLITDVVMEGTDGFSLRDQLKQQFPSLKTIFISGYDLSEYQEHLSGDKLFTKPVKTDQLLAEVNRLLGKSSSPAASPTPTVKAASSVPKVTAAPKAAAAPKATVAAKATPVPRATAVPKATAAPKATSVGQAKPAVPRAVSAAPKVKAATPKAVSATAKVEASDAKSNPEPAVAGEKSISEEAKAELSKSANLRNLVQKQGFTGKLDQFQLVDIIQMCCLGKRTGKLTITKGLDSGVLFLRNGSIVHAVCGGLESDEAVYEIICWDYGQFSFEENLKPDQESITAGWEHLVMEGIRLRDERGLGTSQESSRTLVDKTMGGYRIIEKIGEGDWGETFKAEQTSMGRTVVLKVLWPHLSEDPSAVQEFIAIASAKANVQHKNILTVYEAGQEEGHYFFAHEYADGPNLREIKAEGKLVDDQTALAIIRATAEAFYYLSHNKIPHEELDAKSIYLCNTGVVSVANLASVSGKQTSTVQQDIQSLSRIVGTVMQAGASASTQVKALLAKMLTSGNGGFLSWGALIQAVKSLETVVIPADAEKMGAKAEAAKRAVAEAKKRQQRTLIYTTVGMIALFWILAGAVYWTFFRTPQAKDYDIMMRIPAGEFIYQDGQVIELPEFWIDKHEVTIAQYAEFLEAMENEPTDEFDHPDRPSGKSYRPEAWDMYYAAATRRGTYQGVPIRMSHPVFNVDWYDAYSFANWKGRRLPTEQEWEKAARGTDGRTYPWGNEFDPRLVNSSVRPGEDQGHRRWAPVDAYPGDVSPFGVVGMAGNLAEWTGSWDDRQDFPGYQAPVIRGGSFESDNVAVTRRSILLDPAMGHPRVGFRTASDTPPETGQHLDESTAEVEQRPESE